MSQIQKTVFFPSHLVMEFDFVWVYIMEKYE